MGFILLPSFTIFIQNFMTLMFVNGLWKHGIILVHGTLDQNQESDLPYYESHNHIHEDDHSYEDGFCDCNSQGPWQPLFKPSQVIQNDHVVDHESDNNIENSIDSSSIGHAYTLPKNLHSSVHSSDRKAKKQNHMIHLHLIPHIYVPVLHPVTHPTYPIASNEHQDEQASQEVHSYDHYSGESNSVEHSDDIHNDHGYEHEPYLDKNLSHQYDIAKENLPSDIIHHDISNHFNVHVPDASHESKESTHLRYIPHEPEPNALHQYEVHEEQNRDHHFGNYATGSNVKTKILLPSKSLIFDKTKMTGKQKYGDRGQLNKKHLDISTSMRKLRMMRPPPLGQKETWMTNFHRMETRMFPKSLFEFKSYSKNPLFNIKLNSFPKIQPVLKPVSLVKSIPSTNLQSSSPIIIYPMNTITKRENKVLKTKN